MLYLTCTTITSVDLAHYGVSRAKDWVSVDCGTRIKNENVQNPQKCFGQLLLRIFLHYSRQLFVLIFIFKQQFQ